MKLRCAESCAASAAFALLAVSVFGASCSLRDLDDLGSHRAVSPGLDGGEPGESCVDGGASACHDAGPSDPRWGCLGAVQAEVEDPAAPLEVPFTFSDLGGNTLPNISVKLCRFIDVDCQSPMGAPYVSDAEGTVRLPLYRGFRGYLDIAPSEEHPELLPTVFYVPVINAQRANDPQFFVTLGSTLQLTSITQQAGKPTNPAFGHLVFIAYDCLTAPAAEVAARTDPRTEETYAFYFDSSGVPSTTQEKTAASGQGGVINLAPGVVVLSYDRDGQRIGSQNVIIRRGGMTYVTADPTP